MSLTNEACFTVKSFHPSSNSVAALYDIRVATQHVRCMLLSSCFSSDDLHANRSATGEMTLNSVTFQQRYLVALYRR